MLEYFAFRKFKSNRDKKVEERAAAAKAAAEAQGDTEPKSPILNAEEEAFLERITSQAGDDEEEIPPPLPARPKAATAPILLEHDLAAAPAQTKGKDAQTALMDGADQIPLPKSPPVTTPDDREDKKRKNYWAWVPDIPRRAKSMRQTKADTTQAADTLAAAAETVKKGEGVELNADGTINLEAEAAKEKQDLAEVLDQLNLAAVNNRVFSFSKESQDLMEKFKQVLKDLVNGAPHAYNDLERLLKDSEKQLDKMYGSLPPFLQNLIKQLPTKVTAALAPELMAAAAEKPDDHLNAASASAKQQKKSQKYAKQGYKYAKKYPPLKKLVSEQGAIAAMLRAILNFLKLRFPAVVTGTNVLMSLAVFILLFVFWYCHKRGREVRLEREAASAQSSQSDLSNEPKIVLVPGTKPPGSGNDGTGPSDSMSSSRGPPGGQEPPITIHDEIVYDDSRVIDLPSVLDLPDPKTVPLPEGADEGLNGGGEGKGKGKEV
ncbi:hypothetical protein BFW01_g2505 [Lasiodiplodia theobromae]|uniref:Uncharacterized protein n=1 Tax=Lasiodiplodia theobromae TaxID=45133 RepID=A0A5N5DR28_9PEZI|nr:uncharacterized protein LTHEOB_5401 [Lasiodiplodia theobromae]KAB2579821.1 hypothetical protein DBV05_g1370 [Lasiodiplodia theobromae]KAF4544990.1 hypothetical protein LTHEOB_5401 [Lasiodiplodia theobromae]KAF9631643.1 hypothetical protein BFW01_g2505 [Lasiodiplodia theobromae]